MTEQQKPVDDPPGSRSRIVTLRLGNASVPQGAAATSGADHATSVPSEEMAANEPAPQSGSRSNLSGDPSPSELLAELGPLAPIASAPRSQLAHVEPALPPPAEPAVAPPVSPRPAEPRRKLKRSDPEEVKAWLGGRIQEPTRTSPEASQQQVHAPRPLPAPTRTREAEASVIANDSVLFPEKTRPPTPDRSALASSPNPTILTERTQHRQGNNKAVIGGALLTVAVLMVLALLGLRRFTTAPELPSPPARVATPLRDPNPPERAQPPVDVQAIVPSTLAPQEAPATTAPRVSDSDANRRAAQLPTAAPINKDAAPRKGRSDGVRPVAKAAPPNDDDLEVDLVEHKK